MSRLTRSLVLIYLLLGHSALAPLAWAHPLPPEAEAPPAVTPHGCDTGMQASGALYQICMPDITPWNGELLVYAHGYVAPNQPLTLPTEAAQISVLANLLGYAFATTSYSTNGLAVLSGTADLIDLVNIFTLTRSVTTTYLLGFSEGGLITTLAVEQHPDVFDGGLAACGPIGDFQQQINYWGDFRVVFDYYFPDLLPGTPISIPTTVQDNWASYEITITQALQNPANTISVTQLLSVTQAPVVITDSLSVVSTTLGILWYNVFATNDGIVKLGGQPFDNNSRYYSGSLNDSALNQSVFRTNAELTATTAIAADYQTTGVLTNPLVTLHTTGDPIVPYWHAPQYYVKTIVADNIALHQPTRVERYGHCTFTTNEVLAAFNQLVTLVQNPPPYQPTQRVYLPSVQR